MKWERIHTTNDWYDGPLVGVADVEGRPHIYVRDFSEARDDWTENYRLQPIGSERLALIMEQWALWEAWRVAFDAGRVPISSHPATSKQQARYHELETLIGPLEADPATSILRRAQFRRSDGKQEVCWLDPAES